MGYAIWRLTVAQLDTANSLHGAESFMRIPSCPASQDSQHFMEPRGPLP
jgi:hypothetical protein